MKKQKNLVVEFTPPYNSKIVKIFSPYYKVGVSKTDKKFVIKIPEIDKFSCIVVEAECRIRMLYWLCNFKIFFDFYWK